MSMTMEKFPEFPLEIQDLIWKHACDPDVPRVAMVQVNFTVHLVCLISNRAHLRESAESVQVLLATSRDSRAAAHRFIASQGINSPWNQRLGLSRFHFRPHTDLLYIKGRDFPINFAATLGLVVGNEFSNIMLNAKIFCVFCNLVLQHNADPVPQSLAILRGALHPSSRVLDQTDQGLPTPGLPRNLYFLLCVPTIGHIRQERSPCVNPEHGSFCIHYDLLDIIPAGRVGEWTLSHNEQAEVNAVTQFLDGWAQLGIQLPHVYFVRLSYDPPV